LAIDQGENLDRVPFAAPVDQAHVGGDADAVVPWKSFQRDRAERAVAPVAGQKGNLVERRALHAAVPALDRVVELAGEDGDEEGGGLLRARQRLLLGGKRGRRRRRRRSLGLGELPAQSVPFLHGRTEPLRQRTVLVAEAARLGERPPLAGRDEAGHLRGGAR